MMDSQTASKVLYDQSMIESFIFVDEMLNQSGSNKWYFLYPPNLTKLTARRFLGESATMPVDKIKTVACSVAVNTIQPPKVWYKFGKGTCRRWLTALIACCAFGSSQAATTDADLILDDREGDSPSVRFVDADNNELTLGPNTYLVSRGASDLSTERGH